MLNASQRAFMQYQDKRVPVLSPATYTLLDCLWEDDYESWGLVNQDDDPQGLKMVLAFDALVRRQCIRPLNRREVARMQAGGWHDQRPASPLTVDPYGTVLHAMDDLFHLFNEEA